MAVTTMFRSSGLAVERHPERMLPDDLCELTWDREPEYQLGIRWQHFARIYGTRWESPSSPRQAHWLFAGVLEQLVDRPGQAVPPTDPRRVLGRSVIGAEGVWTAYHTYSRITGPGADTPHPTLAVLRSSAPDRPAATQRHLRLQNDVVRLVYGEPLCLAPNMDDAQRDLIQPLVDAGDIELHFDEQTYYEYYRFVAQDGDRLSA